MPKTLLAFVFSCLIAATALAQTPVYEVFDSSNGLPTNAVFDVVQDKDGTLLFCMNTGVVRYDGKSFTPIYANTGRVLQGAMLKARKGSDGEILFQGYNVGIMELLGEKTAYIDRNKLMPHSGRRNILDFYVTPSDELWFKQKYKTEFVKRISAEGQIDSIGCDHTHPNEPTAHIFSVPETGRILSIICNARVKTQTSQRAERILEPNASGWTAHLSGYTEAYKIIYNSINTGLESQQTLWWGMGNLLIEKNKLTGEEEHRETASGILAIDSLHNGNVMICTEIGVYEISKETGKMRLLIDECVATGLHQDHEGGIWISTLNRGMVYIPSHYLFTLEIEDLDDTYIMAVEKIDQNIGILNGYQDLYLCHRTNNSWAADYFPRPKFEGVKQLRLQIKTFEKQFFFGFGSFDIAQRSFQKGEHYVSKDLLILDEDLYGLSQNEIYNVSKSIVSPLPKTKTIKTCFAGNDSIFIIGSREHLYVVDRPEMRMREKPLIDSLDLPVADIKHIRENQFLICGDDRLLLLTGEKLKEIEFRKPLAPPIFHAIYSQTDSIFWLNFPGGIFRLEQQQDSSFATEWIDRSNGLPGGRVNHLSIDQDTMYIATEHGVRFIDLNQYEADQSELKLRFKDVLVNDSVLIYEEEVIVPKDKRNVRFTFSAVSFKPSNVLEYGYKLLGYHDDWVTTTEGFANYYNLPPGHYNFQVKIRQSNGVWSEEMIAQAVVVPPKIIEQTWFRIAVPFVFVLFLSGLAFWYFRQRDNQRKAQHSYSSAQLQALGLQMNPHFLFNALNNIQALSYAGQHKKTNAFMAKLALLTRKMLENSAKPLIPLADELHNVSHYLAMEQIRFENKPFTWTIDIEKSLDDVQAKIPPMLLQPIVENTVWHGLLRKDGDRNLTISCTGNTQLFRISIKDNGVGFDMHATAEKSGKASISLNNIKKRINLYNTLEYGRASVQISSAQAGPNQGTEITFDFETNPSI